MVTSWQWEGSWPHISTTLTVGAMATVTIVTMVAMVT